MNGLSDMGLGTFTLFVVVEHCVDIGGCVCGPDGSLRFTVSFHVASFFVWYRRESLFVAPSW